MLREHSFEQPPNAETAENDEELNAGLDNVSFDSGMPASPASLLTDKDRRLPKYFLPTTEKIKEMDEAGLSAQAALIWADPRSGELEKCMLDPNLQVEYETRIRRIRAQGADKATKDKKLELLHRAVIRLLRIKDPELISEAGSAAEVRHLIRSKIPIWRPRTEISTEQAEETITALTHLEAFKRVDALELVKTLGVDEGGYTSELPEATTEAGEAKNNTEETTSADIKAGRPIPPLRALSFEMHRAHQTGIWSPELTEKYLELMDLLPQFYQHRMAYMDLLARAKRGEMEMPETMVSVMSGPLEESMAQKHLQALADEYGLKPPKVINVDFGADMLKGGVEKFKSKHETAPESHQIRALAQMLPFIDKSIDLAECSSLDSLASPEDVYATISEMVRITKPGGHLRVVFRYRLNDEFFKAVENDFGLDLITKPHTAFHIDKSHYDALKKLLGPRLAEAFRSKIGNEEYIIATRARPAKGMITPEQEAALFAQATEKAGPDRALAHTILFNGLHALARERADMRAYALTKGQQEELVASPERNVPAAPAAAEKTVTNPPPETAMPAEVAVPSPEDEALQIQMDRIRNKLMGDRPQDITFRKRMAGTLIQTFEREHRNNPSPSQMIIDQREARRKAEIMKMRESLIRNADPFGAVRLIPREDRIDLLWSFAPRVAQNLVDKGII